VQEGGEEGVGGEDESQPAPKLQLAGLPEVLEARLTYTRTSHSPPDLLTLLGNTETILLLLIYLGPFNIIMLTS